MLELSNDEVVLAVNAEVDLIYTQNDEIGAGMCSCVCISNENCCGCIMQ